MPIVKQCELKVVFDRLFIDTNNGTASAYFSRFLDGVKLDGDIVYNVGPDLVGPLLYGYADHNKTRSADIAFAVYNLAVQQGWFSGEIV